MQVFFTDFTGNDNSNSFKFKPKLTGKSGDNSTKNVEIMVSLKCLSKMPPINCKTKLILTWSASCFITSLTAANQATAFAITDTILYVPAVTLSTDDNAKLLQQRRAIIWNKFQSKATIRMRSQYLYYLTDPRFLLVNRLCVLSFENGAFRKLHTSYFFKL